MSAMTTVQPVVHEAATQEVADATAKPPHPYDAGLIEGRNTGNEVQPGEIRKPNVDIEDTTVPVGPSGSVSIRIVGPKRVNPDGRVIGQPLGASATTQPRGHVVGHAIGQSLAASLAGRPRGHVVGHALARQ